MKSLPNSNHKEIATDVAVLIATCNRPQLLANRALPSVLRQSFQPGWILVVDDSDSKYCEQNRMIVNDLFLPDSKIIYLENRRTQGASGAWNTGIDHLNRNVANPDSLYLAILDDDDEWKPYHIEDCLNCARKTNSDMVAPGIVRIDKNHPEGRCQNPPHKLEAEQFIVGNPHIQGSNLFVKLSSILHAGCFDEALLSTTDRDLCIRLADLGSLKFSPVESFTVKHFAISQERISKCKNTKHAGLSEFYRKYRGRMTSEQKSAFQNRAKKLFGWTGLSERQSTQSYKKEAPLSHPVNVCLVVGIIVDPGDTKKVHPLLEDIGELSNHHLCNRLEIVILENGESLKENSLALKNLVDFFREKRGLPIYLITMKDQEQDLKAGLINNINSRRSGRLGIGTARTLLQKYVYLRSQSIPGAIAWIIDDDMRLDNKVIKEGSSRISREKQDILANLSQFKELGVPILLGSITGDPPLPSSSTVRTQLVDLYHNLAWLENLNPEQELPDRSLENVVNRNERRDYYYDLSHHETDRLETPFWLERAVPDETVGKAFHRIAVMAERILAGEGVFRPLVHDSNQDSLYHTLPSINRGGNTFIFDIESLRDVPNASILTCNGETRRSDMLWALLNRFHKKRIVKKAPIPVRHDRSMLAAKSLDFTKLSNDIKGYALYSTLHDLLKKRQEKRSLNGKSHEKDDLKFNEAELAFSERQFSKYLEERAAAFTLSFHRIIGIAKVLKELLNGEGEAETWWHSDLTYKSSIEKLRTFIQNIEKEYSQENLLIFKEKIYEEGVNAKEFLNSLASRIDAHTSTIQSEALSLVQEKLEKKRKLNAQAQIKRLMEIEKLDYLGSGGEGVVFTDGQRVFKYLDLWKTRATDSEKSFLNELVGKCKDSKRLYPILDLVKSGIHSILVYPYEEGETYTGGRGEEMIKLLRESKDQGIVCSNIRPSNLTVTDTGLHLIDYGLDIQPYTEEGFEHMCKRAWLSWRWHHRPDLRKIMRKALTDSTLPELKGYERFRAAVEPASSDQSLRDLIEKLILECEPGSILDYGCGKGNLLNRLSKKGIQCTGYDPAPKLQSIWAERGDRKVEWGGQSLLNRLLKNGEEFDTVLCSRVICAIEDEEIYQNLLDNLKKLVSSEGKVILAMCNPFYTLEGSTPLQRKYIPDGALNKDKFQWKKYLYYDDTYREDVHRSFDRFKGDITDAGFTIEEVHETETVDLERFEPSSDYLVIVLRPLKEIKSDVTLMIKTCFMEAKTISRQVRHIVKQLERPCLFTEKVLVIDSREDRFPKQYTTPDVELHKEEVETLLAEGIIDRVVYGPDEEGSVRNLNIRWFDLDTEGTHAAKGQQVASTLAGFEAAKTEYILQVDSDSLFCRMDPTHDYLSEMIEVLKSDPKALTVSFNICHKKNRPYTYTGPNGPWRVEVRACLFHRERLLSARPYPNQESEENLLLPWYRSFDKKIQSSGLHSYRGGDNSTFYIHPQNDPWKKDLQTWMLVMDRVEQGYFPSDQVNQVNLSGTLNDWLGPKREEPFIFVICGRNVPPGRFRRCLNSLEKQNRTDWGAIIIDDGSNKKYSRYIELFHSKFSHQITFIKMQERRGRLANLVWAIRHICRNSESVIVTLDMDDCLLGDHVISRVAKEYDSGADVTIGSMLRTDKHKTYSVNFEPLKSRGGNVWQHLRTFRKYLFDSIPDDLLRLNGKYVEMATDWAYMVPIVEMAQNPVHIKDPLYLYEPSGTGKGAEKELRETIIEKLLSKNSNFKERRK